MSDFRREYGMSSDDLASLGMPEFRWLLQGLSDQSRFRCAWHNRPKTLHDPADRAELIAAARR